MPINTGSKFYALLMSFTLWNIKIFFLRRDYLRDICKKLSVDDAGACWSGIHALISMDQIQTWASDNDSADDNLKYSFWNYICYIFI